jgi:hypothetical protein
MDQKDRSAVLYAAAFGPGVGLKVTVSFLKMKRAARKAEKKFYRELLRSGLPREEARDLALEYGSAVSIRKLIAGFGGNIPAFGRR